mmetsp:Transcript_4238/g.10960  ORF Transcript_4238/g.10960 Transcript_4238/m.10960 type:complete len:220 (-) Transcript_4238:36-695(-)
MISRSTTTMTATASKRTSGIAPPRTSWGGNAVWSHLNALLIAMVIVPSRGALSVSCRGAPSASRLVRARVACTEVDAGVPPSTGVLVGAWEMLSGPFVGATFTLDRSGAVEYAPPSEIWRGGKWAPLGAKSAGEDGGVRAVRVSLISKKSGDELVFQGDVSAGGEPGSLAISGRVKRNAAQRRVSRWDFAKQLAWGEARGEEDKGPFVLLKRAATDVIA